MDRIRDIENELLNPNCDIVNLLRRSHLFAVEEQLFDFDQWVLWELNGYPKDTALPSYRVLQGKLKAYNPATGWVAFNLHSAAKEKEICTQNIRDSISSLVSLLETGTPPFHVELSGEQQSLLNAAVTMPGTMKYAIHYSRGQVNDIIENVKTCLLEHIASLRKEGKIETGKELPSGARQATDDAKIDKTVFISHRSVDKYIADILLEFFVGVGIPRTAVFCSSLPGNDVVERVRPEVKAALHSSLVNIAILSRDYYNSAYCLNEAGIIWFLDSIPAVPIALPEITHDKMVGFLDNDYIARRLDNSDDIAHIYEIIIHSLGLQQTLPSVLTTEMSKLIGKYNAYLKKRAG